MRKTFTLLFLVLAITAAAQSQTKMSAFLQRYAARQHQAATRAAHSGEQPAESAIAAFVKTAPGAGDQPLQKHDCTVLTSSGDIYIAVIPASRLRALAADEAVVRIEANEARQLVMDTMHIVVGADKLQPEQYQKWGFHQAYTGKGVVVGITDNGFDFTHPMFRDAQGNTRIREAWDMFADQPGGYVGLGTTYKQEQILAQKTMTNNNTAHGSHVMGIAVGSQWQGYRGVAFESDILAVNMHIGSSKEQDKALYDKVKNSSDASVKSTMNAVTDISDVLDYLAVKYVLDYAKEHGQPCVVNCSWTGQESFSTKNSLSEEFVNSLTGPGRIIVAGVGNDGDTQTYFEKKASERIFKRELEFRDNTAFIHLSAQGPYTLKMVVDALSSDTIKYTSEEIEKKCTGDDGYQSMAPVLFPDGRIGLYNCTIYYDGGNVAVAWEYDKVLLEANPKMTLIVESDGDARISTSWGKLIAADMQINSPYTIGAPAAYRDVIAVGGTAWREGVRSSDGKWLEGGQNLNPRGEVISWSGTGPTISGLTKPDVVAPGQRIVSAFNSFLAPDVKEQWANITRRDTYSIDGKEHAMWVSDGTSMACPVASGVIALWLQADPTLTPQRIKEVISRTATRPAEWLSYPNNMYGYGQIDAYRGLLDILGLTAIETLSQHEPEGISFRLRGDQLYTDGAAEGTAATIYNLQGAIVSRQTVSGGALTLAGFPEGVYAVQIGRLGSTLIRK